MRLQPNEIKDDKTTQRLRVLRQVSSKPSDVLMRDWIRHISEVEGVSVQTIYRWQKEAERGKVTSDRAPIPVALAIASGPISITVKSRTFTPAAVEYGVSLLMNNPHMDVKQAYAELAIKAEDQGWETGSLQSFYRAVNQLPEAARLLTRAGKRGLEAVIKPAIRRDITCYQVYEELVGDQHIFDYTVVDDDGFMVRPQMFVWGDTRSRYLSGVWPVMGNYDKYAVGMALREACKWGIPQVLHTDWGKPECSKYVQQLRRQLSGYAAFKDSAVDWFGFSEEVRQYRSKPRNAQAKPIESWFYHAFERPLMQMGLPGYSRREHSNEKENEFIQANLRKSIKGGKLLHAKEFFDIVLKVWSTWNTHIMTDQTVPEQIFLDGITRKDIIRFPEQVLDFIFLPAERRKVNKSLVGITLPGYGKCQWYSPRLSGLNGKHVEVRYNPYEPEKVYILNAETQEMIDIAEQWKMIDPHDRNAMIDKIRRQNQILRYWIDSVNQLRKTETKIHRLSPYAGAVGAIATLEEAREKLVVNRDEVDQKIINISKFFAATADEERKQSAL